MKKLIGILLLILLIGLQACAAPETQETQSNTSSNNAPSATTAPADMPEDIPEDQPAATRAPAKEIEPALRIEAEHLQYLGAFRLPGASGGSDWDYSGHGLTFYPAGDPGGEADGFSGSLYGFGHDHQLYVSEISIPAPIISNSLDDLNVATTIQPFQDITDGIFVPEEMTIPRAGLTYDPANDLLHFVFGQHLQYFELSHGWAGLDLSNPQPAGAWLFGEYTNYTTSDYLLTIPEDWAATYTSGQYLATGRFREGVWGGFGPALFAYNPFADGNPPAANSTLSSITPLLLYGVQEPDNPEIVSDESMQMNGYLLADHWWGAEWLSAGEHSALIFTGTKAMGNSWYGFANGVVWAYDCAEQDPPTCPDYPEWPYDDRGYWAEAYQGQIIFFDTNEIGAVALGELEPYDPQPYAILDLTPYLFDAELNFADYKRDLIGAVAFDAENGYLYVIERMGDEYQSVIHVFKIMID